MSIIRKDKLTKLTFHSEFQFVIFLKLCQNIFANFFNFLPYNLPYIQFFFITGRMKFSKIFSLMIR